jgi:hypothetical protein
MTDIPVGRSNQIQVVPPDAAPVVPEVAFKLVRLDAQADLDPNEPGPRVCEWCCEFFEYKPRGYADLEKLHVALKVTGPAVRRVHFVCNGCFEKAAYSALRNDQVETPGVSNSGPPNLVLRGAA